jgi:ectoine hydroxylase-related dioxygenase (phytanoyl-CoA dioxygenase family)
MTLLTSNQMEQFHRDGFLKFGRVIDMDEVGRLRTTLQHTIDKEMHREDDGDLPPEFRFGHDRKGGSQAGQYGRAIHQFVNMWKVAPEYQAVIHNRMITEAVRELMGAPQVRIWHDQVISKPPGDNKKFGFHHDFYFWPLDRPTMISCWLALDHATPQNGCMHCIPGSHRDPRYQPPDCDLSADISLSPTAGGPGDAGSLYDAVRTWDVDKAVPVELQPGECMFHHCLNYHMTPQNISDRQRRAFVIIYMPDGTRYKHSQSPGHVCTSHLGLQDGALMNGELFPVCG